MCSNLRYAFTRALEVRLWLQYALRMSDIYTCCSADLDTVCPQGVMTGDRPPVSVYASHRIEQLAISSKTSCSSFRA